MREAAAERRKRRRLEEECESGKCLVSNCRFGERDWQRLSELWSDQRFGHNGIIALQDRACQLTAMPNKGLMDRLAQFGELGPPAPPRQSPWCDEVCRLREDLRHCVISWFSLGHGEKAFLFLFALQQPLSASFVPVVRRPRGGGGA